MVKMNEFYIASSDGISKLHCISWRAQGPVAATLQLSHGMMEHVKRYDEFAINLALQGIAVIGHDHLGHGKTAHKEEDYGYFADKKGAVYVIKDLYRVTQMIKKEYGDIPHFILGHSMGSFFVRKYLTIYEKEAAGAVIIGTGYQPLSMVMAGKMLSVIIGGMKGPRFRSPFIHKMVLGNYNKSFKPTATINDWLSGDLDEVKKYTLDPMCNFLFTCSAYKDFFSIILSLYNINNVKRVPVRLPIILLSGSDDPVGGFSKGVNKVYQQYKKLGIWDLSLKLYPQARHEILNEIQREEVYKDISDFIWNHLKNTP